MKRVVLLIRSLDIGGTQRQLVLLAKGLRSAGADVRVVTFYPGGALLDDLEATSVSVVNLGKRGRWDVLAFLTRLIRTVRREQPIIIYGFLPVANIFAVVTSPFVRGVRIAWGMRASNVDLSRYDWFSRCAAVVERALARFADCIIVNSEAGRAHYIAQGFPSNKMHVISNGIDTKRFRFDAAARGIARANWGVQEYEILIGMSARLDPMKGYETFLEAASQIAQTQSNVRFVCVGDGPPTYRDQLKTYCRRLGISDRVVWAGSCKDMVPVYSAFDIATSASSYGEGFSNAVAEAMSCARPCVVTNVGDSALIVGETGRVVPPRNPAALFEQWMAFKGMLPHELQEIGNRARQRIVDLFSVDHMVNRTLRVLGANGLGSTPLYWGDGTT